MTPCEAIIPMQKNCGFHLVSPLNFDANMPQILETWHADIQFFSMSAALCTA